MQIYGAVEVFSDAKSMANLLNRQMNQLQPEGGTDPAAPDHAQWGPMLKAIAGWRISIDVVRARFKYGNIRPAAHRLRVADRLEMRNSGRDADAARRLRQDVAMQPSQPQG